MKQTWMERTDLESLLTITEVAEILRMHPATIYRLVKRGDLPGFKIGNGWRISETSLHSWLSAEHSPHQTPEV